MSELQSAAVPQKDAAVLPPKSQALRKGGRPSAATGWNMAPYVLFFAVWEIFSRVNGSLALFNPLFLPAPSVLVIEGWALAKTGVVADSLLSSSIRIAAGFMIGSVLAVALAVLMVKFSRLERWISPVLTLVSPIPALALLPLFIIWFGIGEFPKVLLIAWTTFVPVLVNTLDGFKSVPSTLIRSALSLGASERQVFTRVMIPSAVPNLLIGAQISLGLSFSALIVAEMMGADSGLGYIIVDARNYFKITNMFVAIILIGMEYSLFSFLLKLLERRVLAWRKGGMSGAVEK
ncbi:ABC transporter permease [Paenibacillus mucilaginosus]|uniref:Nitrate/sulfonate/bicarbonate ABC transporter permease n=2 Tax=Paenibacillus mucilaginosus TaxID=61624 RepID=H6NRJ6_9BACL|nr:ABC transporter permease [Paenibacillus mucilaginosus]AEI38972.1 nitrate/sulfonate/bicarbonate ABC transporter permease [Paenibacillus mucilaginosus KNP414]AFC27278.1 nitrate/sulfonate/bicarbonate ABC transporter permease [Paenibacillus mucilaginosus 3016]MCG7216592.1 ABC transporter permease [Paenibacillus mucilaginosus]WDM28016.1 ABC transporter permease [Paenibacillus mucilaginosus]WFA16192.1 ABC transporter permease [Paenibacillus mucilaginosus]